jgi:hypothetical protein
LAITLSSLKELRLANCPIRRRVFLHRSAPDLRSLPFRAGIFPSFLRDRLQKILSIDVRWQRSKHAANAVTIQGFPEKEKEVGL